MSGYFDNRVGATEQGAQDELERQGRWVEDHPIKALNPLKTLPRIYAAVRGFGDIGAEVATQVATKEGVGAPLTAAINVFRPSPQGESSYTSLENRGLAEYHVPPVKLPPVPDDPALKSSLTHIYGKKLEHWDESFDDAAKTPEGQERLRLLRDMAKSDPHYNNPDDPTSPYQKWNRIFANDDDTFWRTVLSEYKESRKPDASGLPDTVIGTGARMAAEQVALGAAFEAPALLQSVRAGKALEGLKAATIEGGPIALGRTVLRAGVPAGASVLRAMASSPKILGASIGATEGIINGPEDHPVLSAIGGAVLGAAGGAAAEKIASTELVRSLGAKLSRSVGQPTLKALAEGDPMRWDTILGAGKYRGPGALYGMAGGAALGAMDETNPGEKAILGAALFGLPALANLPIAKIPIPALEKLGLSLTGARLAAGAFLGPLIAPSVEKVTDATGATDFMSDAEENPLAHAAKEMLAGMVVATGSKAIGQYLDAMKGGSSLLFNRVGQMDEASRLFTGVAPVNVTQNIHTPNGEYKLYPPIEMVKNATDARDLYEIDQTMAFRQAVLGQLPENLRADPHIGERLSWVLERLGPSGRPSNITAQGELRVARGLGLTDQEIEAAQAARRAYIWWGEGKVARGELTREQWVKNYLPRVVDTEAVRADFSGHRDLQSPEYAKAFAEKIKNVVLDEPIDDFAFNMFSRRKDPQGNWIPPQEPITAKWLQRNMPGEFNRRLFAGEIGGTKFTPKEANELNSVLNKADEWGIEPKSLLDMLAGSRIKPEPNVTIQQAFKWANDDSPKLGVFDPHNVERVKGDPHPPFRRDLFEVTEKYIRKDANDIYLKPLIEGQKDPVTGEAAPGLLDEYFNQLGPGHDEEKKYVTELMKNALGYPRPLDAALDHWAQRISPDPHAATKLVTIIRDLTYSGALGMAKVGTLVRNLATQFLAVPALGRSAIENGMLAVARDPEKWHRIAVEDGLLTRELTDDLAVAQHARPFGFNLGYFSEKIRDMSHATLSMMHSSEERLKTWLHTSTIQEVHRLGKEFDPSYLRPMDSKIAREMMEKAKTPEEMENVSRWIGKKTTELIAWRYGPTGVGPMAAGKTTKLFTMFTSWPMNYASLLRYWASSGRVQQIINTGVTVALLDKLAHDQLGITRLTGLSPEGESRPPLYPGGLPTGPLETSLPPVPQLGASLLFGSPREKAQSLRRNAWTLTGPGAMIPRERGVYDEVQAGELARARLRGELGITPTRVEDMPE